MLPRKLRDFARSPIGDAILGGTSGIAVFIVLYALRIVIHRHL